MKGLLKDLFGKRNDDEFVALMQAALEDVNIRQQLLTVLELPHPQRHAQLQKWRNELQAENAPMPLISAITFLENEDIANRALQILED